MQFWNKVGEAINKTGQEIKSKAKEIGDITALKSEKSRLTGNIEKIYLEIGKAVYEARDEKYTEFIQRIEANQSRIGEIDQQISDLKGTAVCPKCGETVGADDHFCQHCGHDLTAE